MSGPLSTIWEAVKTGNLPKSVEAPIWVILISAFGLVIGLGELPRLGPVLSASV